MGPLELDPASRHVKLRGRPLSVSKKEFALLRTLAAEPVRVFTREELLRGIWGYQSMVPTRTLDSHASRLRRKLSDAGAPGLIVNVWGVGYRLVERRCSDVPDRARGLGAGRGDRGPRRSDRRRRRGQLARIAEAEHELRDP